MKLLIFSWLFVLGSLLQAETSSEKFIYVGGIFDRSGPTSTVGLPYSQGIIDYLNYVNGVKGGVHGHKIQLEWRDYKYSIPQAFQAFKEIRERTNPVAFLGWGTGDTTALSSLVLRDRLPYISASYSDDLSDGTKTPYNFFVGASYNDQISSAIGHIASTWSGREKPRITFVYPDNGFGRQPIRAGKRAAEALGMTVLENQILNLDEPDAHRQMEALIKQKADFIVIQSVASGMIKLTQSARSLGFSGKIYGLSYAFEENVFQHLGKAAEGLRGTNAVRHWNDTTFAGVQLAHKVRQYASPTSDPMPMVYMQGVASAMVLEEALRRVKGIVTGESIKQALETLNQFDTGGLTPPVTFTADRHNGCEAVRIYEFTLGKLQPITDFLEVDRVLEAVAH